MKLTDKDFYEIKEMLYDKFGINLTEHKRSLVTGRLRKLATQKGFASFTEFIEYVKKDESGERISEFIDKMSTNHTFFFRENQHFEFLSKKVLPEISQKLIEANEKDLRIWCAAAATGEEPYSIVMTLMDFFKNSYPQWKAGLLATDISSKALATAKAGIYPSERAMQIPETMRRRYLKNIGEDTWEFSPRVRKEITFRRLNLMNAEFPFRKQFHVIMCRNVMIYFDKPTRQELVRKLYRWTAPGGYLFIGHSESIRGETCPYDYISPAIFRKRD